MAVRRFLTPDIRGMTLDAFETARRFVVLVQLLIEHVLVATRRGTRGKDRNVRLEASQRKRFRDVDVADSAFSRWDSMAPFLATALVPKLHRFSLRRRHGNIRRSSQLVTAGPVVPGRF